VYKVVENRIRKALRHHIHERYKTDVAISLERPPKLAMGEVASPLCFELAKRLRKPPRALAQEIANSLKPIPGVARVEVAGGGYLNLFFDRAGFFRGAEEEAGHESATPAASAPKTVVEHTSINPNKAAHIGHLRNAVLGDTFARSCATPAAAWRCRITSTTPACRWPTSSSVSFTSSRNPSNRSARSRRAPKVRLSLLGLYTRVTHFLAEDKSRLDLRNKRSRTSKKATATRRKMGEIVATAIVHCHLRTLDRLGIDYDLLSRESEILHLKFWDAAFEMLKQRGAIQFATSGKNAGCWVMQLPDAASDAQEEAKENDEPPKKPRPRSSSAPPARSPTSAKTSPITSGNSACSTAIFIIAGFTNIPTVTKLWVTSSDTDDPGAPSFGHAHEVFNVIDSRQAYPQQVVVAGLRALGYNDEADHLKHFAYNVVALTPRCAQEMGYEIPPEDAKKPYVEVSGRKGQGVKADDLLDRLETSARAEVDARHPDAPESERAAIAHSIAIGALRYFLLRFTRSTVIAFDFKDALSFEGETGPYVQYAVVRVNGILRKGAELDASIAAENAENTAKLKSGALDTAQFLAAPAGDDLWDLILMAGSLDSRVDQAVSAQEPAFLARFAFDLAQAFNVFYHKHHILSEKDPARRAFLLLITALVREQLVTALGLLGITAPEKM
jgi:arginyl-tRNA synthetase